MGYDPTLETRIAKKDIHGDPIPGEGYTIVYGISDGKKGVWWDGTPMPGNASLVNPIFPVMKPTGSPVTLAKTILSKRGNLILIGSLIAVVFFSKPLMKIAKKPLASVKKIGPKVGVK